MTTLTQLRALAEAAKDFDDWGHEDCLICDAAKEMHAALSSSVVLAMIECIEAAKEMNRSWRIGEGGKAQRIAFDAALAKLEQEQGR